MMNRNKNAINYIEERMSFYIAENIDINQIKKNLLQDSFLYLMNLIKTKILDNDTDTDLLCSTEIEFYIKDNEKLSKESNQLQIIYSALLMNDKIENEIEGIDEEDGLNQFEIQIKPQHNLLLVAEITEEIKKELLKFDNVIIDAKPYSNDAGSAMHFNISLYGMGLNLFSKDERNENFLLTLYWSIGGLLELMLDSVFIMSPKENCYKRFLFPRKNQYHIHYPTNISWGVNNRTCAIRIPKKPNEDFSNSRIEYRIPSPQCDSYLGLLLIAISISYGIENEIIPPEQVYGNAFDFQYEHLQELPRNLTNAEEFFNNGVFSFLNQLILK